MQTQYQIINVNLTSVSNDEPVADVPCGTCTRCCEQLSPFLTPLEIASGLYPLSLVEPTANQKAQNSELGPIVTLYRKREGGCGMFVEGKCSIYDIRPLACRQFDCRKNHHPAIPDMTLKSDE